MGDRPAILVIACGALAHEIVALRRINAWPHMAVQCLPAELHNRPEKIAAAVQGKIAANRGKFASMFVAYADCGTGGQLDAVLEHEGIERIPGAHCYEFFAGSQAFAALSDAEPGTFYLTDFLLRHFDRLILRGLGIDRHPELMPLYFGNYTRLVYLAQLEQPGMEEAGRQAARRLGLEYEYRVTGYGDLQGSLQAASEGVVFWQN
ncbi:MAG: DUF1638 domain-containing protein [Rhodoferax sp.]|nr:DUF1638 domain-containing protein [Rhodoferax sp.]